MADLNQIEKMLTALLRNNNQIHWIGGYLHGRTGGDDPFILLYPSSDRLIEKVCRVYPQDFHKLPEFVDTNVLPGITQDDNPNKELAQKKGIYRPCTMFLITTYRIPNKQMEYEVRFGDVLRVSKPKDAPVPNGTPDVPNGHTPTPTPARENDFGQDTPAPFSPPTPMETYFTYALSVAHLSQGAAQVQLASYGNNPVDALQALQVERGERGDPPKHKEVDATEYWRMIYKDLGWTAKGGQELLNQFHGNLTLAYQHAKEKFPTPASP